MIKIYHSSQFTFPLPAGHRFPMAKYSLLWEAVLDAALVPAENLITAEPATDRELLSAHDEGYVQRVKAGQLTTKEIRRIGLPWSPQLVERARRSVGGTIAACRTALREGLALNLAGGTHHAFADHGQGYCLFNDSAIASRVLRAEGHLRRAVVLDCDVHQGNGTAALAAGDSGLFAFSIHNEHNFPLRKEKSDLDVGLPDGTGDDAYLDALERGVEIALARAKADLAIYLAGADPYEGDQLGRLAVSKAGLAQRDRLVLDRCRRAGLPVAIVLAGGYGRRLEDTVAIHLETVRIATEAFETWPRREEVSSP